MCSASIYSGDFSFCVKKLFRKRNLKLVNGSYWPICVKYVIHSFSSVYIGCDAKQSEG